MGLVGLKGGGYPAMDSTGTSTNMDHPIGTLAYDSSGGEYMYVRGCSTAVAVGNIVGTIANSSLGSTSAGYGLVVTETSSAMTNSGPLGVACSTQGSTASFVWIQVYGFTAVTGDATMSANTQLFTSSVTKGNVMATTTGARIYGMVTTSSGGTSASVPVYLQYPHVSAP